MIRLGNLTVSGIDLAIIAHVVHSETPENWATRAFNHLGEAPIKAKIARHRAGWLAAKGELGYKTAAEKMSDRRTAAAADFVAVQAAAAVRKSAEETALDARIQAEVAKQIALSS